MTAMPKQDPVMFRVQGTRKVIRALDMRYRLPELR